MKFTKKILKCSPIKIAHRPDVFLYLNKKLIEVLPISTYYLKSFSVIQVLLLHPLRKISLWLPYFCCVFNLPILPICIYTLTILICLQYGSYLLFRTLKSSLSTMFL